MRGDILLVVVAHLSAIVVALLCASPSVVELRAQQRDRVVPRTDYSAPRAAPYVAEEVSVQTAMGHTLAGTLTIPKRASRNNPAPAVILITGGGPQDRDASIVGFDGYRPFRQVADTLARRGIAVLRMDDRGVGASGGVHTGVTTPDFARDVRAGLVFLRTRPEIDTRRLALVGHSEGGVIAPLVALEEPDVPAMVLLGAPAYNGRVLLEHQVTNLASRNPLLTAAQRDSALGRVQLEIDSLYRNDPWVAWLIDHDPLAVARRVRTPVLILTGSTDQQITPDQASKLAAA